MNTVLQYILVLFPAGILAGIASTVAGIASLVSYPALLLVGIPPVFANVTNTVALVSTGAGAAVSSRRELRGHGRELLALLPLTVGGSICGGLLLLVAPAAAFKKAVPFFICFAAILILRPGPLRISKNGRGAGESLSPRRKTARRILTCAAIFLVGIYTGYFGAAGGVVMLALLAATSRSSFAEYNALKNVSLGAANLFAAVLFIFRSHIYWLAAVPLAVGFFIGGSVGPRIVRRVPADILRYVIAAGAGVLAAVLFVQAYIL